MSHQQLGMHWMDPLQVASNCTIETSSCNCTSLDGGRAVLLLLLNEYVNTVDNMCGLCVGVDNIN